MRPNARFAWFAVIIAVAIAGLLRIVVQPSTWILGGVLVPVLLAIGFILGGTAEDRPEASGKLDE